MLLPSPPRLLQWAAALLIASPSLAQEIVPNGTLVPGNYTGALRPQVHFSPPAGFMNDPNGMFYDASTGTWHVYYQYNPSGLTAGNQHWGHATSRDLYSWTNEAIAISPPESTTFVFSGSAVADPDNTSGFFGDLEDGVSAGVVAFFTLAHYNEDGSPGPQTQDIAYSRDGGYTFEYYAGNPVIPSTSSQFRDPKVIWHDETQQWVAVVVWAHEFAVEFYTSPNLRDWTAQSNFTQRGLLGAQWECPNLVRMPVRDRATGEKVGDEDRWVLTISLQPGAPLGGSVTSYFVGGFNGTHFVVDSNENQGDTARLTDFAKDNYAAQYFSGIPDDISDGNPINMGWASNWQYANTVPTGEAEGWRSTMTLPRVNYLVEAPRIGLVMVDEPYDIAPALLDSSSSEELISPNPSTLSSAGVGAGVSSVSIDYSSVASGALYLEVNVTGLPVPSALESSATLNVTFFSSSSSNSSSSTSSPSSRLRSGFYFGGDQPFFVDRSRAGGYGDFGPDNVFFTDKFSVADVWYDQSDIVNATSSMMITQEGTVMGSLAEGNGEEEQEGEDSLSWTMKAVIDRTIYEVFVDGGIHTGTVLLYPEDPLSSVEVGIKDLPEGVTVSVGAWGLKGGW